MSQSRPKSLVQRRLEKARDLIKTKRYEEARELLKPLVDHNELARKWVKKIDAILLELDDPFAEADTPADNRPPPRYHPEVDRPVDKRKTQNAPPLDMTRLSGVQEERTRQEVPNVDWDAHWEEGRQVAKVKQNQSQRAAPGYSPAQREMAQMQSFVTKAVIVVILYFVLVIPGLIANWLWHKEGKRMQKIAGQNLPGVGALGCLWLLGRIFIGFTVFGILMSLLLG